MQKNNVEIRFCPKCKWLFRATWISQELFSTFESDLDSIKLVQSDSGIFEVYCNKNIIFSRQVEKGFIDIAIIKQRLRDIIDPERDLGHTDNVR